MDAKLATLARTEHLPIISSELLTFSKGKELRGKEQRK